MVTFLLESRKNPNQMIEQFSLHDLSKRRVVVFGVETRVRSLRLRTTAHDATRPAVVRARGSNRVLVIETARPRWKQAFAIAEHNSVLAMRERPAGKDQAMSGLRFSRQLR
jgi:hypothetical protein